VKLHFDSNGFDVDDPPDSKELPISLQGAALFALWIAWLSVVAWVKWKADKIAAYGRYFDEPFVVYGTVYAGIPLALVAGGFLFLRRARPVAKFPLIHRLLYYVIAGLTLLTTVVFLVGCIAALRIGPAKIRE
jgi:hypothetical protein